MNAASQSDLDRVNQCATALGEHFDSVQIFCTRHESGELDGTVNVSVGRGNWFARYGQVREWLTKEDESAREQRRQHP